MRTGEGKTLTAVAPLYLNALEGLGVHLITVNDYLARRDAVWYGPVYHALGLSIGVVQNNSISYLYEPGYKPGEEGSTGGLDELRPCSTPRRLRRRHHLRDEQRVRLRLPARQHGPRGR